MDKDVSLELAKQYLRIDYDDDDELLKLMIGAAKDFVKDAVGTYDSQNPKMQMLFLATVQELYENRIYTVTAAQKRRLSYMMSSLLLQLQCEAVRDDG